MNSVIRDVCKLASFAMLAGAFASTASAQFSLASPLKTWRANSGSYLAASYQYDDGTSENAIGLTSGGDMGWLSGFDTIVTANKPGIIEFTVGWSGATTTANNSLIGTTAKACIWKDANNDGNPSDGILLSGPNNVTVTNVDDDVFMTVTFPGPTVSGKFFLGMVITHAAGQFPASLDTATPSNNHTWFVGTNTAGGFNYASLGSNSIPPIEIT